MRGFDVDDQVRLFGCRVLEVEELESAILRRLTQGEKGANLIGPRGRSFTKRQTMSKDFDHTATFLQQ